mmetsp:Transcript_989/g.1710  ORF Transcript_989/g.1710 Transcript_989/m.1710 type:complete len:246 (-) Transcript_989:523-1260(-)
MARRPPASGSKSPSRRPRRRLVRPFGTSHHTTSDFASVLDWWVNRHPTRTAMAIAMAMAMTATAGVISTTSMTSAALTRRTAKQSKQLPPPPRLGTTQRTIPPLPHLRLHHPPLRPIPWWVGSIRSTTTAIMNTTTSRRHPHRPPIAPPRPHFHPFRRHECPLRCGCAVMSSRTTAAFQRITMSLGFVHCKECKRQTATRKELDTIFTCSLDNSCNSSSIRCTRCNLPPFHTKGVTVVLGPILVP